MGTILFTGSNIGKRNRTHVEEYQAIYHVKLRCLLGDQAKVGRGRNVKKHLLGGKLNEMAECDSLDNLMHCVVPKQGCRNVEFAALGEFDLRTIVLCEDQMASNTRSTQRKPKCFEVLVTTFIDGDCLDTVRKHKIKFVVYIHTGDHVLESVQDGVAYLGIPLQAEVVWDFSKKVRKAESYFKAIKYSSVERQRILLFDYDDAYVSSIVAGADIVKNDESLDFQLFDPDALEHKIKSSPKEATELRRLQKKMPEGKMKTCPLPKKYDAILNELLGKYPNFENVVELVRREFRLENLRPKPMVSFGTPILIDGPPGIGKSAFLMELSGLLGTYFYNVACASASNGFDMKGLSSGFGSGKVGHVYKTLANGHVSNPIILLDEVEKATTSSSTGSSLQTVLYELLEPNNAKVFEDEYLGLTLDTSRMNWVATSNHAEELPAPILDRFQVVSARMPTQKELRKIIQSMFRAYVKQQGFVEGKVSSDLTEHVISALTENNSSIRGVGVRLKAALGRAVARTPLNQQVEIGLDDLEEFKSEGLTGMGFILN